MDKFDNLFGVPVEWAIMILLFWFVLAALIFGADALEDGFVVPPLIFCAIGSLLLIGKFGWMILVIPSVIIITAALAITVFLIWERFN